MQTQKDILSRWDLFRYKLNLLALQLFPFSFLRNLLYRDRNKLEAHFVNKYRNANLPTPTLRISPSNSADFTTNLIWLGEPILFRSAAKEWRCTKNWDLDFFANLLGNKEALIVDAEGLTGHNTSGNAEFLSIESLVKQIRSGSDKYLRFSPLLQENPALMGDLDMNWLEQHTPAGIFGKTQYLFLGGRGTKTHLHSDQPCNLFIQIHGRKKWRLYPISETIFLYPEIERSGYIKSRVNLAQPDYKKFPLLVNAKFWEIELNPGDILYVPPHIWHFVENIDDTIAVGYRFSHLRAALTSSIAMTLIRIASLNPPIWQTMSYGKLDTNLIWAHSHGNAENLKQEKIARLAKNK